MNTKTKKIVITALMAALVFIATTIIKVPTFLKGYLNLGDCIVLLAGWTLSPMYGFLAAGLGSALADIFSGYVVYAPATFVIKGLMSIVAFYGFKFLNKKLKNLSSRIISATFSELVMILGYYVFEGFMYGFGPSLLNIAGNAVQAVAGLIIGVILIKIFEKSKITIE